MKNKLSILTIIALACTTKSYCIEPTTDVFAAEAKGQVEAITVKKSEPSHLAADGRVQHPEANFEKQVASGIVILDFFATWCPPCKRFGPVFVAVANKKNAAGDEFVHADKAFIKIDIDKHTDLTGKYNILSMPTIIALKDGKEVKRVSGSMTERQFENWIKEIAK